MRERRLTLAPMARLLSHRLMLPVASHEAMTGMQARHQGAPGRSAHGIARVVLREPHALRGQPVDMGRLEVLLPVAAQVAVPGIVGHDVDDVRFLWGRRCRKNLEREAEAYNGQEGSHQEVRSIHGASFQVAGRSVA